MIDNIIHKIHTSLHLSSQIIYFFINQASPKYYAFDYGFAWGHQRLMAPTFWQHYYGNHWIRLSLMGSRSLSLFCPLSKFCAVGPVRKKDRTFELLIFLILFLIFIYFRDIDLEAGIEARRPVSWAISRLKQSQHVILGTVYLSHSVKHRVFKFFVFETLVWTTRSTFSDLRL